MKSVLISIRPQWCEKIASGEKTIEVRKTAPKEVPFKAYIYCSKEKKQDDIIWAGAFGDRGKWNGHIIGEFICDKITKYIAYSTDKGSKLCKKPFFYACLPLQEMCLTSKQIEDYGKGKPLYGWHISDLKIYDKPLLLSELGVNRPPQSW